MAILICATYSKIENSVIRIDTIEDCSFTDANLKGAFFWSVNFNRCRFNNAILNESNFFLSEFTGCTFNESQMIKSSFNMCILDQVTFDSTNLENSSFSKAGFLDVSFYNSKINRVLSEIPFIEKLNYSKEDYKGYRKLNSFIEEFTYELVEDEFGSSEYKLVDKQTD